MAALVSVSEVKNYLSISSNTEATNDANIAVLANYASKAIETYCSRTFAASNLTEIHDGGRSSIFLDNPPINYITAFSEYDGTQYVPLVGSTASEELANTNANANAVPAYVWNSDTGEVSRSSEGSSDLEVTGQQVFRNYKRGIKVTYNGGYTSIPDDIKLAALDYIKIIYKQDQASSSFSLSGETKEHRPLSANFPPHIRRILELYRII